MEQQTRAKKSKIGKTIFVYLGSAWVFIEAFNFIIDKYHLDIAVLDVIILLVIFGLPASIIHAWFGYQFTRKSITLHSLNLIIAIGVISYDLINPDSLSPTQISLLNFKSNQKKLAESIRSLAVLPLSNHTGEKNETLIAGIHDALIGELGQISAIRITPRRSTLSYTDSNKTIQEIATELGVDGIIEASMLKAEKNINIQIKLIAAYPQETLVWSQSYQLPMEEVLSLYSNVTKSIAKEINITLSPQTETNLNRTKMVDPTAYEYYLTGKVNLAFLTPKALQTAEQYFLKSIEIDPDFGPAYGGLAGIWISRKQLHYAQPEQADPKMKEYLNKSFELDSTDAEVWRWHASKLGNTDYNWEACNRAMDKCLELNPSFGEARAFYAHYLMIQNRWDEAWEQMDEAMQIDPLNPLILAFRSILLIHSGRFEECLIEMELLKNVGLSFPGFFISYSKTKQYDRAIDVLNKKLLAGNYEQVVELLNETYRSTDFSNSLIVTADALVGISDSLYVSSSFVLELYSLAGEKEKSLDWIEKLYIKRDPNLPYWAIKGPLNEFLQQEPRYIEIMRRINLR